MDSISWKELLEKLILWFLIKQEEQQEVHLNWEIVNIPDYYWGEYFLYDMFLIYTKYYIILRKVPRIDTEKNLKGNIVHTNGKSLVDVYRMFLVP